MTILASYNLKGGVGKTTTAVNLAYLAAEQGLPTLLWDLDPQGAASFYLRIQPFIAGGIDTLLEQKQQASAAIKASDFDRLHLLPADFSYRKFDLALADLHKPAKRLRRMLTPLTEEYAMIILDCPPGMSVLAETVFKVVDALLVPTIPTPLSMRTCAQLFDHLSGASKRVAEVLPFFSMVEQRKRMHREIMQSEFDRSPAFLRTLIPFASDAERMGAVRAPLPAFAPDSAAAKACRQLWREIGTRIDLAR